jgi:GNAT superfamily N-acetyltransferase
MNKSSINSFINFYVANSGSIGKTTVLTKTTSVNISSIQFVLLQHKPEHFAQVAIWHHQECERQGLQSTLAIRQQRLLAHVQQQRLPKTVIALRAGQLLGCVSLVHYSYRNRESHPKLANDHPVWLSNLYVPERHRRHGLGNLLIEAVKKYAREELGLTELWLSAAEYTDYYRKRGWQIVRRTRLGGRSVNVMRTTL